MNTTRESRAAETRARVVKAGYRPERSISEWMAHPDALEDLARVICGFNRVVLCHERARTRALEAEIAERSASSYGARPACTTPGGQHGPGRGHECNPC